MKLEEIENIKNRDIICVDFDDCLIPWMDLKLYKNYDENFIIEETNKNVKLLSKFIEETKFEPFITSSWSKVLNDNLELNETWDPIHYELLDILKQIKFIGKDPFNDRILAVEILLENGNRVIGLDDCDYSAYFQNEFNNKKFFMINLHNGIDFDKKLKAAKKFLNL